MRHINFFSYLIIILIYKIIIIHVILFKKSVIKYSIKDSQNTFIIEASTPLKLEVIIEKLKKQENNIQPCILVVGSLLNPKQIIVYFDDVKYKLFSVFKAIDICFKLFHVFNLEYPYELSNV